MSTYKVLQKNNVTVLLSKKAVIKVYNDSAESMRDFENDLRIWEWLSLTQADNLIVPLMGSCDVPCKYIENELIYWEYGGKSFGTLIVNNALPLNGIGNIRADVENCIVGGLLNGVKQLHMAGFVHGDLKPDNILLNENYHVRIADFGMTIHQTSDVFPIKKYVTPVLRSSEHLPAYSHLHPTPEEYDGKKLDIWSIGITLVWMLAHKHDCDKILEIVDVGGRGNMCEIWLMLFGKLPTEPNYCVLSNDYCLESTRDIIEKCLVFKHADRPSITNLI